MKEEKKEMNSTGSTGETTCSEDKGKDVCSNDFENENCGENECKNGEDNNCKNNGADSGDSLNDEKENLKKEMEKLRKQLEEATSKCEEYFNMLQRTAAEFDNYKKRTQKEKEVLGKEVVCDVVATFIPVVDNLERALKATEKECDLKTVREGIELVYNQFSEILKNLGVEQIKCVGEKFNPNFHDAVMHVKDEAYGEGEVVEELRKGYVMEDKVIRHSMVKVAN
ncbi:MAG: nucleotide exchange factor GrpE [Firmicutes bacterium]|nr:nucleotide exchange factor GrpE [Bacillota bacterium]